MFGPVSTARAVARMRSKGKGAAMVAIVAACLGCRGDAARAPEEAHVTRSRIRFVHPWFELPDGRSEQVGVRLDGHGVGSCWRGDRDKTEVCTETLVEPGPHVVEVIVNHRDNETLRISASTYYRSENRIHVGVGEDVAFDLSKVETAEGDALVSRRSLNRVAGACLRQLDALASAATCTAAELSTVRAAVGRARTACRSVSTRTEDDARTLFHLAHDNVHRLPLERCMTPSQMKGLPGMIHARAVRDAWPRGTLEIGSWWWAREALEPPEDTWATGRARRTVAQQLGDLHDRLPAVQARLGMLEELIAGYASKSRPAAAIDRALTEPFSLDPSTLHGHRLWHLVNRYWTEAYDPRLAAWLASAAARDQTKSCALQDEAEVLVSYWMRDETLTAAEWTAVQAMIGRTPPDERIASACVRAVDVRLRSDVPALDRLGWLTRYDCSDRRHPRLRAEAVRRLVTGSPDKTVDPAHRRRVRADNLRCLGGDE
jgi:hypothetical protein